MRLDAHAGTDSHGSCRRRGWRGATQQWSGVVGIVAAAVTATLVVSGILPVKTLGLVLPLLVLAFLKLGQEQRLYAIIITIAAPVSVPLLGKDGGTVTTFLVFFAVFTTLVDAALRRVELRFRPVEIAIYLLALVGLASFGTKSPELVFGSVRPYYIFLSGLCLFWLIVKSAPPEPDRRMSYAMRLLDGLFVVAAIQVAVGLLVYFVPPTGAAFTFFLPTQQDGLHARVTDENIRRLTTLITGPEPTGEMLAMLAPLVLCRYFDSGRAAYLWLYLAMACAEVLTATRSTNALFALASLMVIYAHSTRARASKVLTLLTVAGAGALVVVVLRPDFGDSLLTRLAGTRFEIGDAAEIGASLNRASVWAAAVEDLAGLPPFGHGFARVRSDGDSPVNFHSLYLTTLYQLGWLGAPVLWALLAMILVKLARRARRGKEPRIRAVCFCSFVALALFLVNEIKYEFNRHQPYMQFCWVLLALFYLLASEERTYRYAGSAAQLSHDDGLASRTRLIEKGDSP